MLTTAKYERSKLYTNTDSESSRRDLSDKMDAHDRGRLTKTRHFPWPYTSYLHECTGGIPDSDDRITRFKEGSRRENSAIMLRARVRRVVGA